MEAVHLGQGEALALERDAGEVVAARDHRAAGLVVEMGEARLQPPHLLCELFFGGGDVHQPAAQRDEQLLLLVVGVVEDLARVLRLVERAAHSGGEEQPDPGPQTHDALLSRKSGDGAECRGGRVSESVSKDSQFRSQTVR